MTSGQLWKVRGAKSFAATAEKGPLSLMKRKRAGVEDTLTVRSSIATYTGSGGRATTALAGARSSTASIVATRSRTENGLVT